MCIRDSLPRAPGCGAHGERAGPGDHHDRQGLPERNQIWGYRESDPLGGVDPYSASKAAADLVTQSWIASSGSQVPTAIARAGNVIGGGDVCADRLMVDLVQAFSTNRAVRLRYPDAVRPWQHVLDCLNGYLELASALLEGRVPGEAFNFGPG